MSILAQEEHPLTQAQLGIYYGQLLQPQDPAYNTAEILTIRGHLDDRRLCRAVRRCLLEAEGLRARLGADEEPWQRIDPRAGEPDRVDTRSQVDPHRAALDWIAADRNTPLDLHRDRLYRYALMRVGDDEHWLYQRIHHVAIDGFGANLLFTRIAELYRTEADQPVPHPQRSTRAPGQLAPLEPVLRHDQQYQASERRAADRQFWWDYLEAAGSAARIDGPPARTPRRAVREVPDATVAALRARAGELGRGWPELVIAACAHVLHAESGRDALLLGVPVLGRLGTPALRVPTTAMNVVPLLSRVEPGTYSRTGAPVGEPDPQDLIARIAAEISRTRAHHRYRHEHLRRDRGVGALFHAVVNVLPFGSAPDLGPDLRAQVDPVGVGPVENLSIAVRQIGARWRLEIDADPHLWSPARQEALLADVLEALAGFGGQGQLRGPSRISGVALAAPETGPSAGPAAERWVGSVPGTHQGTWLASGELSVPEAISQQARRNPTAVAVRDRGRDHTYADLLTAADRIATLIRIRLSAGCPGRVAGEPLVAVALPRGFEALAAFVGAWRAGAGYLPIDPTDPPARIRQVLHDAHPDLLLLGADAPVTGWSTQRPQEVPDPVPTDLPVLTVPPVTDRTADRAAADQPTARSGCEPVTAAELTAAELTRTAYLIYTSGSTGAPKGVVVQHDSLAGFVRAAHRRYRLSADDRVVQFAPVHFDTSIEEIFPALACGATVVIRPDGLLESVAGFLEWCDQERVSVLDLPTAYWHELAFALGSGGLTMPASVRTVIIGGSAAGADAVSRFDRYAPQVTLINSYGPTETTVVVTTAVLSGGESSSGGG